MRSFLRLFDASILGHDTSIARARTGSETTSNSIAMRSRFVPLQCTCSRERYPRKQTLRPAQKPGSVPDYSERDELRRIYLERRPRCIPSGAERDVTRLPAP